MIPSWVSPFSCAEPLLFLFFAGAVVRTPLLSPSGGWIDCELTWMRAERRRVIVWQRVQREKLEGGNAIDL